MRETVSIIKSTVLGHAVGDALGVPVEFYPREELQADPVCTMQGFGTYPYPPGTWSDDTSMTLAALDSLSYGLDYNRMMDAFCHWLEYGEYTPPAAKPLTWETPLKKPCFFTCSSMCRL